MAKASIVAARQAETLAALQAQTGDQTEQLNRIEAKLDALLAFQVEEEAVEDEAATGEIPQSTAKKGK